MAWLTTPEALLAWLATAGIAVETCWHPPVFTVEEARVHTAHLPGGHTKNLFLEDRKGGLWLVTCLESQPVKINGLARLLGAPRFSFGSAERLQAALLVEPGSVTPLALVNDPGHLVRPVLDRRMLELDLLNFHPLRNIATCTMRTADFRRFLERTGHEPVILDLDHALQA